MMQIRIKRIYENPEPTDGYRMLVDRLWPRGVSKEAAAIDEWNKAVAPSTELRKWFGHQPELFDEFVRRYKAELKPLGSELERMLSIAKQQGLTLIYSARDPERNQAKVLSDILNDFKTDS